MQTFTQIENTTTFKEFKGYGMSVPVAGHNLGLQEIARAYRSRKYTILRDEVLEDGCRVVEFSRNTPNDRCRITLHP